MHHTRLVLLLFFSMAPLLEAAELQTFEKCTLIPTEWADGDSFRIQFPDGKEHTIRLYGADCLEKSITDPSDARRLRAQRRYFGISNLGGSSKTSIDKAKFLGHAASVEVKKILQQPFTVHTAFADGRGDGKYQRIYGFITTADGKDLATELVKRGLARAFGVYRSTPGGISRDEYREQLKDAELAAAGNGAGIWEYTDWNSLPAERRAERDEEADTAIAMGQEKPTGLINVNTASRDELMKIPGIGEVTANRIIEKRPFKYPEELVGVRGIGAKTLEKIKPYVTVD
jgi:competence protein ComEA